MGMLQEFREFAVKGNAIDLAVGIVIGAAFTKIVNSIVNDLVMPPIGLLVQGVPFKNLRWTIRENPGDVPDVTINYGNFINTVVEFLIVAWAVFVVVRIMNRIIRAREAAPAE